MAISNSDVEDLGATGWSQLDDAKKTALRQLADQQIDDVYSDRLATLPEREGSRDSFHKLLTAHYWTLAEGGEVQSESSEGGSASYNTVTGEPLESLTQTKWGREALKYLRSQTQIGFVRTR